MTNDEARMTKEARIRNILRNDFRNKLKFFQLRTRAANRSMIETITETEFVLLRPFRSPPFHWDVSSVVSTPSWFRPCGLRDLAQTIRDQ